MIGRSIQPAALEFILLIDLPRTIDKQLPLLQAKSATAIVEFFASAAVRRTQLSNSRTLPGNSQAHITSIARCEKVSETPCSLLKRRRNSRANRITSSLLSRSGGRKMG